MDTFDIHMMDKHNRRNQRFWIILVTLALVSLLLSVAFALRYVFRERTGQYINEVEANKSLALSSDQVNTDIGRCK